MKLSKTITGKLDERFVLYDPEQELTDKNSLVNLVCPLHGPYTREAGKLDARYLNHSLKPPGCPGCRHKGQSDPEYLRQVNYRFRGLTGNAVMLELYPPAPEWYPMDHWVRPTL